jgi:hypothetical protein
MQITHSSAGWFFHLGGHSWSEGAKIVNKTGTPSQLIEQDRILVVVLRLMLSGEGDLI